MKPLRVGLACALTVLSLGCSEASPSSDADDVTDESADELRASHVFRCSVLANQPGGAEPVYFLRVSGSRVTWNKTKSFSKSAGARIAPRDKAYTPQGTKTYARYEGHFTESNHFWSHDWRLDTDLLTGGRAMQSGDLGGFAIFGTRIDWYSSVKYVCFAQ